MPSGDNVFINCPFDEAFYDLLRPLIFTVVYLQLTPRIALEAMDSGTVRIDKIVRLIRESPFAIHDLSRIAAAKAGELSRLNMPFELGLDLGARCFGQGGLKRKKCLVLETEPYRYKAALSDLSGSDIAYHEDNPARVVKVVRDWLRSTCGVAAPGPSAIWDAFNFFMDDLYVDLKGSGFSDDDVKSVPVPELIDYMVSWTAASRK